MRTPVVIEIRRACGSVTSDTFIDCSRGWSSSHADPPRSETHSATATSSSADADVRAPELAVRGGLLARATSR
jgi:hypothetical protein